MKKLLFLFLAIGFCLVIAPKKCDAQNQSKRIAALENRVKELETYVYQNVIPKVSKETVKKCSGKKTLFSLFGPIVREVKLCTPFGSKTGTVKVKRFLLRSGSHVLVVPASKNGVAKSFKVKVGRKYQEEKFTRPILVSKIGHKITIR